MDDIDSIAIESAEIEKMKARLGASLAALSNRRVLGAQLGQMVNEALGEGRNYKAYFPHPTQDALRRFVEQFLSDLVVPTEERSGQDRYFEAVASVSIETKYADCGCER